MNWFFFAISAPALYSISNHIDKYLISRYFKGGSGPGALTVFSSLVGLVVFPIILIVERGVWSVTPLQALLVIMTGILTMVAYLLYFYSLQSDETSIVVPIFQLIPVFSFILGFLFLGEVLTLSQIIGGMCVILGSVILSLAFEEGRLRIKKKVLLFMATASFILAVGAILFKFVAIDTGFWIATFWSYIGYTIFATFVITFIPSYRSQFTNLIQANKVPIIGLNVLNELIGVVAGLLISFAFLLAPVALVQAVSGAQPVFVLIYGIILTLFFPKLGTESLVKRHVFQKVVAIFIIVFGVYLINTQ